MVSVENLRQSGWSQGASVSHPATKLVDETRAFQIYGVRLGAGAETSCVWRGLGRGPGSAKPESTLAFWRATEGIQLWASRRELIPF